MPEIKIRETAVLEQGRGQALVEVVIADNPDVNDAFEYVTLAVGVDCKTSAPLAAIQADALRRARALIDQQLAVLAGPGKTTH